MPTSNTNVVALFPLQEVIFDKDGTGPLASGVVSFFSDPAFSVPKDVYEETLNPDNTITYTNLGNVLVLSGIGSFVDGIRNNFIPLLYPFVGSPADTTVGASQPYYITVYSSGGVFQFSANDWPPNSFGSSSSTTFADALTQNLLSNPNFSVVSFTPASGSSSYVYNVTGTNTSNPIAPGWALVTSGTGVITVTQVSLEQSIVGESPYSLMLSWTSSSTLTMLQLVQTLSNSPRIIAGQYAAANLEAASTGTAVGIQLIYATPDIGETIITSGVSGMAGAYNTIAGISASKLPATSTQGATGYVQFIINILNPIVNSNVSINNAQMVQVASTDETPPQFIQQTTQQQLNGLMWYYEPQLAFKPIPSYLLGWDFKFNPSQVFGSSIGVTSLTTNQATYIADQTIVFESIGAVVTYAINNGGLVFTTGATATQIAFIQYLDATAAYELLMAPTLAVQINGAGGALGYISLYATTNAALPSVPIQNNNTVFFTSLTAGIPTTLASGWTVIPNSSGQNVNSIPSAMPFSLNGSPESFTGWTPASGLVISDVKYFAIVVSFQALTINTTYNINYVTLNAGNIATPPSPMNEAQTLQGLQYYYQKSFNPGVVPIQAAGVNTGETRFVQTTAATTGSVIPVNFVTPLRATPTVTLFNPVDSGTQIYNYSHVGDYTSTTNPSSSINPSDMYVVGNSNSGSAVGNLIGIHWTADARLGQV